MLIEFKNKQKKFILSIVFTLKFISKGEGRYSVKCEVVGNDDTEINEGFIITR